MIRRFEVEVEGITPILQHRFSEEAEIAVEGKGVRKTHINRPPPREAAESVCYRGPDGVLYQPATQISALMREAASNHKQQSSRKSMKYVVPAAAIVEEPVLPLFHRNGKGPEPITTFEVDSRPIRIRATGGRVMRHRPRIDKWGLRFHLRVNDALMDPETAHQFLVEGGDQCGLGDYRPGTGGPYGRFRVTKFEEAKAS